jgi:hypothetical protein
MDRDDFFRSRRAIGPPARPLRALARNGESASSPRMTHAWKASR